MTGLVEALIASEWLSRDDERSKSFAVLPLGADVLPLLIEAARQRIETQARLKTSKTKANSDQRPFWADVLHEAMRRGAKLTLGWPKGEARPLERWLGPRLMWWPGGLPEGHKVAWLSSRLGRAIDERPDWFAVLRSATAKLDPLRDLLLTASGTTDHVVSEFGCDKSCTRCATKPISACFNRCRLPKPTHASTSRKPSVFRRK